MDIFSLIAIVLGGIIILIIIATVLRHIRDVKLIAKGINPRPVKEKQEKKNGKGNGLFIISLILVAASIAMAITYKVRYLPTALLFFIGVALLICYIAIRSQGHKNEKEIKK